MGDGRREDGSGDEAVSRRERCCGTVARVYMQRKQGEKARDRPIGRNHDTPRRSEVRARCDRRRAAKSAARHGTPSQWQRSIQKTSKITSVSSSSIPSSTILRSQSPLSTYTNTGGSGKWLNFATQIGNFPSICHEFKNARGWHACAYKKHSNSCQL